MPTSRVQRAIEGYRQAILDAEASQMRDMAQRWRSVERGLEAALSSLAEEAARLAGENRRLSRNQLYEMERYQALLVQASEKVARYQAWAQDTISDRKTELARLGIESGRDLIRNSYLDAGRVVARFNLLPVEAVETMAAITTPGAPLNVLLQRAYVDSVDTLTTILLKNVAAGINPRKTATDMANAMAGNLDRSLLIARTEQLRVFRVAATEQMRASGVVEGWVWRSALQDRTCLSCLAMDGTIHDLDEELNDHPNGRCFRQPLIRGLEPVQTQSGADWFAALDPERQAEIMGDQRYEAYREGRFAFGDLARVTESGTWGREVRVATAQELGL